MWACSVPIFPSSVRRSPQEPTPTADDLRAGYDGPIHMAEEVRNASTIVPWCMICTILLNGALGFAMVLALCFCVGDLEAALASPTGYDFIEVFYNATNSHAATSAMTAVLIVLVICATFGFLASASRQTWAFARDSGLPCSKFLSHVGAVSRSATTR